MAESIEFSVVVPVYNEAGNAADLAREIARATTLGSRSHEIIFVDDASRDDTRAELAAARAEIPQLRVVGHRANAGQSRAIRSGVAVARAPLVGTLDGDGQNDPADLPKLLGRMTRGTPRPGFPWSQACASNGRTPRPSAGPPSSPTGSDSRFWVTAPVDSAVGSRCSRVQA